MHRSEIHRPSSTVAVSGTFVSSVLFVVKSTAEVNRFTAFVFIPSAAVQLDLYTLKAAAAHAPAAAIATPIFTLDIVIVAPVVFLQNTP